jgi:uncharacterized protein (UPF0332 family)
VNVSDNAFLEKADESLDGAESEYSNGRYNNTANRCYYACFQASIHALLRAGIQPAGAQAEWGHDFVQAQFIGQLINRRKLYPTELRQTMIQNYQLRVTADYERDHVNQVRAARAIRRTEAFLASVKQGEST